MPIDYYEKVWRNGKIINWNDAQVHVASHVIHYGSGVFEGIRCYQTKNGPAIFRLTEHVARLINSAKIYRMDTGYSADQLQQAMVDLIRLNDAQHAYIRPVVFRGFGDAGVNPMNNPVETFILTWRWGKYLGHEALAEGIDVCVSSWNRLAPNTLPAMAKASANYMNSQLIKMEALVNGYTEGIGLDSVGNVSEGSGENVFIVRDGVVYTPPLANAGLAGITRQSVITLARELDFPLSEEPLPRESLYIADEVFFTGTAAEITPIRSVDRITVGNGKPGPVTLALQARLLSIAHGEAEDRHGWLTYCGQPVTAK